MVEVISRGPIRPGHPLWTDGWSITIGGSMSRPKSEPGKPKGQEAEPSGKTAGQNPKVPAQSEAQPRPTRPPANQAG